MHPRALPTTFYTYVTKMIDSSLTPRLNSACQCFKYAYAHPCLLSASIVLHLLLYLSFIIPFRKIESPPESTSDLINYLQSDHITLAKAFHQSLYIHLIKTTSLKPILHHVFRSQSQVRNGHHYPIISCSKPTLQPRDERLLEMLQMPTHQQSSGVITLLRQLPACEG